LHRLPQEVKARIDGLKGLQVEHTKVETKFQMEILALEKKVRRRELSASPSCSAESATRSSC
jgi:nucleosome assembly protein 1-like 1